MTEFAEVRLYAYTEGRENGLKRFDMTAPLMGTLTPGIVKAKVAGKVRLFMRKDWSRDYYETLPFTALTAKAY